MAGNLKLLWISVAVAFGGLVAYIAGTLVLGTFFVIVFGSQGASMRTPSLILLVAWLLFRLSLLFLVGFVAGKLTKQRAVLCATLSGLLLLMALTTMENFHPGIPPTRTGIVRVGGGSILWSLLPVAIFIIQFAIPAIGGWIARRYDTRDCLLLREREGDENDEDSPT